METEQFAKGVERLVDPMAVGAIHFLQPLCELAPAPLLQRMMASSTKRTPKMGFVVEPYAFFLFFRLADPKRAAELLPTGYRLAPARVFENDEAQPLASMSFFRVHTGAFWGARAEFYLIAENERTGLLSWVIIDYLSDTISHDRAFGLRGPSSPNAVVTVTAEGYVVVDMETLDASSAATRRARRTAAHRDRKSKAASGRAGHSASNTARNDRKNDATSKQTGGGDAGAGANAGTSAPAAHAPSPEPPCAMFSASLSNAHMRPLDKRLWVEGNTSIAYGKLLSQGRADAFSLTFLPQDMSRALDIPADNLQIDRLNWFSHLIEPQPIKLACFPFAQHVLSDSPGNASSYTSQAELAAAAHAVSFATLPAFQVPDARTLMTVSGAATGGLAIALVASLLA